MTKTPATETRVTKTPVTETLVTKTPPTETRDTTEPADDDLLARLRRESEERAAAAAESGKTDDSATGIDPGIAELLIAAEAVAEQADNAPPVTPAAPPATGTRQGLVGHWTFDEGRGTVAMDMSDRGANGTITGGKWARGRMGGALEFDGKYSHVTVANESNFDIRSAITVAAWIRVDSFTKYCQTIVCKGDTAWRLQRNLVTNSLSFACTGLTGTRILRGNADVSDGAWHHVAGSYDGTTMRLYVDGAVDASAAATGNVAASEAPVWIGGNSEKADRNWRGAMDDVRVYERALSADEIRTLADPVRLAAAERGTPAEAEVPVARPSVAPPAPLPARVSSRGLVGHWTFDEGHGTVAGDSSGKGGSATVHGAKWTAGRVGGALEFDGVNDYVRLPDGFADFTGGLTFAL